MFKVEYSSRRIVVDESKVAIYSAFIFISTLFLVTLVEIMQPWLISGQKHDERTAEEQYDWAACEKWLS